MIAFLPLPPSSASSVPLSSYKQLRMCLPTCWHGWLLLVTSLFLFWLWKDRTCPDQDRHCHSRQLLCAPPAAHGNISLSILYSICSFFSSVSLNRQWAPCKWECLAHLSICIILHNAQNIANTQATFIESMVPLLYLFSGFSVGLHKIYRNWSDWQHIFSNRSISIESIIGIPSPSKTLPIILPCK